MDTNCQFLRIWTFLCLHVIVVIGLCPNIISRSEWGASPATKTSYLRNPVRYVFIHHTAGNACTNRRTCIDVVRAIQRFHMRNRGWADIGYSFLIGGDGSIFEGRGWNKVGSHTRDYNSVGYGISFLGTFTNQLPTQAALNSARRLISCGVQLGKMQRNYVLRGHRDMGNTECPGRRLYDLIKTWPHY